VWAIGYHLMNINAAVLMGGVAGARTHSGPAREAAKEIDSSVPWVGFPIGYAVAVLLTVSATSRWCWRNSNCGITPDHRICL
jgi:putative transport protein